MGGGGGEARRTDGGLSGGPAIDGSLGQFMAKGCSGVILIVDEGERDETKRDDDGDEARRSVVLGVDSGRLRQQWTAE